MTMAGIVGLGPDLQTLGRKGNTDGYELFLRQLLDDSLSVPTAGIVQHQLRGRRRRGRLRPLGIVVGQAGLRQAPRGRHRPLGILGPHRKHHQATPR